MVGRVGFEPTTIGLKEQPRHSGSYRNQSLAVFVQLGCASK